MQSDETPLIEDNHAATNPPPPAETDTAETVPSLEEMLRRTELVAQEHHDAWLRAKAETDNVRKRALVDVDNARKYALESFAGDLLAVRDALEAALATEKATTESLRDGVGLTHKQLTSVLGKFNIVEVNPLGEKFDPHRHQAIGMTDADAEPNTVTTVLQKGYLLNDRVLRPALVMVAKAKA